MIDAEIARNLGVTRAAVYEWWVARKLPPHRTSPTTNDCWQYYLRGENDKEIAQRLGLKQETIRQWRYRHNLPAVSRGYEREGEGGMRTVTGKGTPDYRKYYDCGWNDAEIASAVNRTPSAVQSWRRQQVPPLAANASKGRPTGEETHIPTKTRLPRRRLTPISIRPTPRKRHDT